MNIYNVIKLVSK